MWVNILAIAAVVVVVDDRERDTRINVKNYATHSIERKFIHLFCVNTIKLHWGLDFIENQRQDVEMFLNKCIGTCLRLFFILFHMPSKIFFICFFYLNIISLFFFFSLSLWPPFSFIYIHIIIAIHFPIVSRIVM